ncbi:hypothetical protein AVEN_141380-1 [Araneus ventricosus]|uniref:Uncharacterized protein n=1 Tax=Araneus ventricosus TaxID=182803 RepID=A0A4Y2CYJ2_ARAVE|nr:hypothetical protein AVEN_141380-1 [Araneus ventricosus]
MRGLFGDGPRHFEPRSENEEDTRAGTSLFKLRPTQATPSCYKAFYPIGCFRTEWAECTMPAVGRLATNADSRGEGVFTFGLDEKPAAVFYPELSHILTQYGALGASQ